MRPLLKYILPIALLSVSMTEARENPFALGGDISGTTELEANGIYSYNIKGEKVENTRLMHDLGMNMVRLRVWVNPNDGFCSPEDVLVMARRAKAEGMDIMIDFHYSDWWADPGHQNTPEAWKDMTLEQTEKALAEHTSNTLKLLKDNGIDVKWVQIGNETTNGFVWPTGRAEDNFAQYAALTKAGYEAAKSVYPEAYMIVHLDRGFEPELYRWMFDGLRANGTPWDMIGMSVYPYWSKRDMTQDSSVTDVMDNIKQLNQRYHCPVMIVETGVEVAKPEEGRDYLRRLINAAIDTEECAGVIYWAPESGDGQYPLGAFSNQRPTVILDAFTEASERLKRELK